MDHLLHPNLASETLLDVTPPAAGWRYLSFRVLALRNGKTLRHDTAQTEVALVPLRGEGVIRVGKQQFTLARQSVFAGKPQVLYVPPGHDIEIEARPEFDFALGGAPAEGRYPVRLFRPEEMRSELRGGGAALRQVNHILAAPLPAERLILFEVYVPGGMWAGWPPHCHDGYASSPYLEETYYYRIDPPDGFALHRNYRRDTDFDETLPVHDGDLVLVTQGFHPVAVAPGCNVYFLNYLAGELLDEARAAPPLDDSRYAWMKQDWDGRPLTLPVADAR
jgi:5-deoxy-glucuronate isomerase